MTAVLVGQFDSPYVRRVAVTARLLDVACTNQPWSVGADQAKLRKVNPLGRVPAWIEADGEVFVEAQQIVDHLDDGAGARALMPRDPALRRETRQWLGLVTGVLDKGIAINIERIFNGVPALSTAWTQRCRSQLADGVTALERRCAARAGHDWLVGEAISQADVALACYLTYLRDSLPLPLGETPALAARVARLEAQAEFAATYKPFDAPTPTALEATP